MIANKVFRRFKWLYTVEEVARKSRRREHLKLCRTQKYNKF